MAHSKFKFATKPEKSQSEQKPSSKLIEADELVEQAQTRIREINGVYDHISDYTDPHGTVNSLYENAVSCLSSAKLKYEDIIRNERYKNAEIELTRIKGKMDGPQHRPSMN